MGWNRQSRDAGAVTSSSPPGTYPISVDLTGVTATNYTLSAGAADLATVASGSTQASDSGGGGGGGGGGAGFARVLIMLNLGVLGLRRQCR